MSLKQCELPWSDSIVLVCTKCARKIGDEQIAQDLKDSLKAEIKQRFGKDPIRVSTASCLGVCPEKRITIVIGRRNGEPSFEAYCVEPGPKAISEVLDKLYRQENDG